MLNQIVYLRCDALIGRANYTQAELADVGCPHRATKLQDDGAAFVVSDALAYAHYLEEHGDDDEILMEVVQFLNRVRSFPLDWRTPEWKKLAAKLDVLDCVLITPNIPVD